MATRPPVGESGGQRYDLERAIQTFLQQMAEGCQNVVPAVIKELLQNADDAGATELTVYLDERRPPKNLPQEYQVLFRPALLVRNNAPFRVRGEVGAEDKDDFTALCDVASGHKRAQAVAAGRFGIGFNSVYFLTDTPVLFSRREVHVFDILHKIFESNGWRFSLDEFPAVMRSGVGPVKTALEWMLPKTGLGGEDTFGSIAMNPEGDYRSALLRLPLRHQEENSRKLYVDTYDSPEGRRAALDELVLQAARSMLFLKNVTTVSFSILQEENELQEVARICATPNVKEFGEFLENVKRLSGLDVAQKLVCEFDRTVNLSRNGGSASEWSYRVRHAARFDDAELRELRHHLARNEERAIPWVALAIPKNGESVRLDGTTLPSWRVFLPLNEPGPCGCLLSAALFVGPSRQRSEYRTDGSDEALRKTRWNESLVRNALVPLLVDASLDVLDLIPEFVANQPGDYMALFPSGRQEKGVPTSLTGYFCDAFNQESWVLRIPDIWGKPLDLDVGGDLAQGEVSRTLEKIRDWLLIYRDRFSQLSNDRRHFVRHVLGDALKIRLGTAGTSVVLDPQPDVAKAVLAAEDPPQAKDLKRLLGILGQGEEGLTDQSLAGLWCFQSAGADSAAVRFNASDLYVYPGGGQSADGLNALERLHLEFDRTYRVSAEFGLPAIDEAERRSVGNLLPADDTSVLEMLRRVNTRHGHDSLTNPHEIIPLVDYLCGLEPRKLTSDLRLPFLVGTQHRQHDRRGTGVLTLRPVDPSAEDEDAREVFYKAVFPEMEPMFAAQVSRLLSHAANMLGSLSTPECSVVVAKSEDSLMLLLRAQCKDPATAERLQKRIRGRDKADHKARATEERAISVLFAQAERIWEELSSEEKTAFLSLPVHRRSDGTHGSLLAGDGDPNDIPKLYRLQSEDDIRDAPIQLQEAILLQAVDPLIKRFYRKRLRLEEHNRTAILKQVLREVGARSDRSTNRQLLSYLAKNYHGLVERLETSAHDYDHQDAETLRNLLQEAKAIPCIDGGWHKGAECVDARELVERLREQNWPGGTALELLLARLFPDQKILVTDRESVVCVRGLYKLEKLGAKSLCERALTSECLDLDLKARAKILLDNWDDRPAGVTFAPSVCATKVPCADKADHELSGGEYVVPEVEEQEPLLVGLLAPRRILTNSFSEKYSVPPSRLGQILPLLGVTPVDGEELSRRLMKEFSSIWPRIGSRDRIQLLQHIGNRQALVDALKRTAQSLDVVLVDAKPPWVLPDRVVSSVLLRTKPPLLDQNQKPAVPEGLQAVGTVWDAWCGIKDLETLGKATCEKAAALPSDRRQNAGRQLCNWLTGLIQEPGTSPDSLRKLFRTVPWVLARRGGEVVFRPPADVVVHDSAQLLQHEFWVVDSCLPEAIEREAALWGFSTSIKATEDNLRRLSRCLAKAEDAERAVAMGVYRAVAICLDQQPELSNVWEKLAASTPVFKLFREPDRVLTLRQIFLGNPRNAKDIGESLFCLGAEEKAARVASKTYANLGVSETPTPPQLMFGLASLDRKSRGVRQAHGQLLRALKSLPEEEVAGLEGLGAGRVRTCAGNYRPLDECLWDEELGRPGVFSSECEDLVVDSSDGTSQEYCRWIAEHFTDEPKRLRVLASPEVDGEIEGVGWTPSASQVLGPWSDWLKDLSRPQSKLRYDAEKRGLCPPGKEISVLPVKRVSVKYVHEDVEFLLSKDSPGPIASHDSDSRILVGAGAVEACSSGAMKLDALDAAIATQLADLLASGSFATTEESRAVNALVQETLERPSVVLELIRSTQSQHFLHQYQDQVADPAFAELFAEYQRTREGTERHGELEGRMWEILREKYVSARRDTIRGHGYDEFSVFAELLQNAEDAYVQRHLLGMEPPASRGVVFKYSKNAEGRTELAFEHHGRPFNYWRHGANEDPRFARDVEGVLRSAGSFKAKSEHGDVTKRPVGRFGLGFKSVYLMTDTPRIHSGAWHFEIEAGCLPREAPPPDDLQPGATRVQFVLRDGAQEVVDQEGERMTGLLPFLREIEQITLHNTLHAEPTILAAQASVLAQDAATTVERVEVSGAAYLHGGRLNFLRVRHRENLAQLGVYLGEDGLPSPWKEAFGPDLYVVLPLKTRLGSGVSVSNLFEIQSGRTHLVDPAGNEPRVEEAAALIRELPAALLALAGDSATASDVISRFWSVWNWESGDDEAKVLRKALAREVADLPLAHPVVPSDTGGDPVKLGSRPVVYFSRVPDEVQVIVVEEDVPIHVKGAQQKTSLQQGHVTSEAFALQYLRACKYGGVTPDPSLNRLDMEALGESIRDTDSLAENPNLLNRLAEVVRDEALLLAMRSWMSESKILAEDGMRALPRDLIRPDFAGRMHLPARLLRATSPAYSPSAVTLLLKVGLRSLPAGKDLREWIESGSLNKDESAGILRFLAEEDRFMNKDFRDLSAVLRVPWFPDGKKRVSAAEAAKRLLGEEAQSWNDVFKAWLGIATASEPPMPPVVIPPPPNPDKVLKAVAAWWRKDGIGYLRDYESRTYPLGRPPALREDRITREQSDRKEWLGLLLLGSLHSIGRAKPEQHRDFLRMCDRKGWLDVFADPDYRADKWMDVLEKYLDAQIDQSLYYHWMQQFIRIFQLARWLPEYVEALLAIDKVKRVFSLSEITVTRSSRLFQGGGIEAPPLTRTLGLGACFVVRELARLGLVRSQHAFPYCYVPTKGVRNLLQELGAPGVGLDYGDKVEDSPAIHKFLVKHLGEEGATFGGAFDIPLRYLAYDKNLQGRFLGEELPEIDDEETE